MQPLAPIRFLSLAAAVLAIYASPAHCQVKLGLLPVADGLQLPTSMAATNEPEPRLMILEQEGLIRVVKNGQLLPTPFLDLTGLVTVSGEEGLLDLAFHPDWANNGRLFITYNDLFGNLLLEEYNALPGAPEADPASSRLLMRISKPFPQHNGGKLTFGLDGFLYLTTGDGGAAFDPFGNAQNLGSLLGKVLRIDVDTAPAPGSPFPYSIPPTNPFLGQPGARPEVFAYGLRNPWRAYQDPVSGDFWIGDVGQSVQEELDRLPAGQSGLNFGWVCYEGPNVTGQCAHGGAGLTLPELNYDHNEGCAIVAGPIYRGAGIPGFDGYGLYADHCTGRIWSYRFDGSLIVDLAERTTELGGFLGRISSFGIDAAGEVYVLHFSPGALRKFVPADLAPDCDQDGLTDLEEIGMGSSFDVNVNGTPDECEKLLTVDDLKYGQSAGFSFIGASPGQPVIVLFSVRGIGNGPCFFGDSICLDLSPMASGSIFGLEILNIQLADGLGQVNFTFTVPQLFAFPTVAFQAVAFALDQSQKSNPVLKLVVP